MGRSDLFESYFCTKLIPTTKKVGIYIRAQIIKNQSVVTNFFDIYIFLKKILQTFHFFKEPRKLFLLMKKSTTKDIRLVYDLLNQV